MSLSDIESPECDSLRQSKHLELNDAVNSIDGVTVSLERLFQDITGEHKEPAKLGDAPPAVKIQPPSLVDVLNNSPDAINRKCEEMHKLIDQIRSVLL